MSLRVLIADDDPFARGAIAMILGGEPDIEVVGEAADGREAVDLAARLSPDVVLMDIVMSPGLDGITATRLLAADTFADSDQLVKVLVLTSGEVDNSVRAALRAGASGFLIKTSSADLVRAVRVVADGGSWLDCAVTRQIIDDAIAEHPGSAPAASIFDRLTPREAEVLRHMALGRTNQRIAESFVLSEKTVKTHVSRILMKLQAHDRAHAVAIAYQGGFVNRGDTL